MRSVPDAALPLPVLLLWSGDRAVPAQRRDTNLFQLSDPPGEAGNGQADPTSDPFECGNDAGVLLIPDVVETPEPSTAASERHANHGVVIATVVIATVTSSTVISSTVATINGQLMTHSNRQRQTVRRRTSGSGSRSTNGSGPCPLQQQLVTDAKR